MPICHVSHGPKFEFKSRLPFCILNTEWLASQSYRIHQYNTSKINDRIPSGLLGAGRPSGDLGRSLILNWTWQSLIFLRWVSAEERYSRLSGDISRNAVSYPSCRATCGGTSTVISTALSVESPSTVAP